MNSWQVELKVGKLRSLNFEVDKLLKDVDIDCSKSASWQILAVRRLHRQINLNYIMT